MPPFMRSPPELNYDPIRLLDHVYGDFNDARNTTVKNLIDRAILIPKNRDVDASSDHAVQFFPGEKKTYLSADRLAQDENEGAYPTELLNSKNPPGFAPHQLRLKVDIPIILLRNADPVQGLANGTRLLILHLSPRVIEAKILTGIHVGQVVYLPRIHMDTNDDTKGVPFILRRGQYPVRPAFAMTINKFQRQSFQKVAIYLPSPVFAHGQLYVALSRIGDPTNITMMVTHPPLHGQPPPAPRLATPNVVSKQVFMYMKPPQSLPQQPEDMMEV
ncbi:atp-dependent dna helicase pif1 [Nannochloropsis oceanica]